MRFLLLLSFFLLFHRIQAQEQLSAQTIYYAPNAYELTADQKASLDEFVDEALTSPKALIAIQAFTDDIGSFLENRTLAKQRANAVKTYLFQKGIDPQRVTTKSYKPSPGLQNDAERQKYRKVVLTLAATTAVVPDEPTPSTPDLSALEAFWEEEAKAETQAFELNPNQSNLITGAKGVKLYIPENAFCYEDGRKVEGTIKLSLREIYSVADIILNNLSTTSDGQLLETAGMLYLKAEDEEGRNLVLQQDSFITASLPNYDALKEGMEIFEGAHGDDGHLNWQVNNTPVQNSRRGFGRREDVNPYAAVDIKRNLEWLRQIPLEPIALPQRVKRPSKRAIDNYYVDHSNKLKSELKSYIDYSDSLRSILEHQKELLNNFDYRLYIDKWSTIAYDFRSLARSAHVQQEQWNQINNTLEAYVAAGYDFETEIAVLNNIVVDSMSMKDSIKVMELYELSTSCYQDITAKFGYSYFINSQSEEVIERGEVIRKRYYTLANFSSKLSSTANNPLSPREERKLRRILDQKPPKDNYDYLKEVLDSFVLIYENHELRSSLNKIELRGYALDSLYWQVEEKRKALGILNAEDIQSSYGNVLRIQSLKWVNCDRFLDFEGPKTKIEILVDQPVNTAVYVVFKNIKSVIGFSHQAKGRFGNNMEIPLDQELRIVALHIRDGQPYLFVQEGYARDLEQVQAEFSPKTKGELQQELAKM